MKCLKIVNMTILTLRSCVAIAIESAVDCIDVFLYMLHVQLY